MITTEQRQILTEKLFRECWHELRYIKDTQSIRCKKCGNQSVNRTFDNWNDFGAVVEKLTQSGQRWNRFKRYARKKYNKEFADAWYPSPIFDIWLLENPERFCILVADAIRRSNKIVATLILRPKKGDDYAPCSPSPLNEPEKLETIDIGEERLLLMEVLIRKEQ